MPRLPRFHRLAPVPGEYLSRAALNVISPHQTCEVGPFPQNLLIFGETLQQVGAHNDYCLVFDHY